MGKGKGLLTFGRICLVSALAVLLLVAACARPAPAPSPAPPAPPAPKPAAPASPAPKPAAPASPTAAPAPAKPPAAAPQTRTKVDVLTAPFGTVIHTLALAAGDVAKKYNSWLTITAAETPGYIYNVEFMDQNPTLWGNTIIGSSLVTNYLASKQQEPFKKQVLGFKYLLAFASGGAFFATLNPKIKTYQDLVGKKVALGYPTQVTYYTVPIYLFNAMGIKEKMTLQPIGSAAVVRSLLDGLVDAGALGAWDLPRLKEHFPDVAAQELLASGKKVSYLSYPKDAFDKVVKDTGMPLMSKTVPAGAPAYPGLANDILITKEPSIWAARDTLPEEIAYEFTRLHLKYFSDFWRYHKVAEGYSPELFVAGLTKQNTHAGAVRAYAEAGINLPDK